MMPIIDSELPAGPAPCPSQVHNGTKISALKKAVRAVGLLLRPRFARRLGTLITAGYLAEAGWVRSVCSNEIVDIDGDPVPWTTYPFIDFITPRLATTWRVFEYGAGASTRFLARRVARVVAVEHDAAFAARLQPLLPDNARLIIHPAVSPAYAAAIAEENGCWDLVSIDGIDRTSCVREALPRLAPHGVLILDDSERVEYGPAIAHLRSNGFRAIEFWGLAPGRIEKKCTSVFYRSENVLGL